MFGEMQFLAGAVSGGLVGFSLGLFGGGGSVLAVPLLVNVVGVTNVHVAIGTSALSVTANALSGLAGHARRGTVNWRCAGLYSATGIAGAALGAELGKALDGQRLMLLFSGLMVVVALAMLRARSGDCSDGTGSDGGNTPKIVGFGAATGLLAGFFGIGGGFLIVPGLIGATGMAMINAIGSSLAVVSTFGLATAISYSWSGLVDWPLAAAFVFGGAAGAHAGCHAAHFLAGYRRVLNTLFAGLVLVVAVALAWKVIGSV